MLLGVFELARGPMAAGGSTLTKGVYVGGSSGNHAEDGGGGGGGHGGHI